MAVVVVLMMSIFASTSLPPKLPKLGSLHKEDKMSAKRNVRCSLWKSEKRVKNLKNAKQMGKLISWQLLLLVVAIT